MPKFTKKYNIEPTQKQRESISSAFKITTLYFLNEEKKDVEIITQTFNENQILATLNVNGMNYEQRVIGVNGGITVI